MRRALRLFASLALICVATAAQAQTDEQRANARALAAQGVEAFDAGHWQAAVDLFDRAESLVDAPTHLLFGARAHAKLHHYVKARELYMRIAHLELAANAPKAFRSAQQSAEDELKDVEPHIGRLTITVRGPDPKATKVLLDDVPVESVLIGIARPIDPGEHRVRAEAPGFAAQTKTVTVADGAPASIALELAPGAASDAATSGSGEPPVAAAPIAPNEPAAPPDIAPSHGNGKRVASYVALGVGVVGLGLGSVFMATSASKRSDANKKYDECGGSTGCTNGNPLSKDVGSLDDSARSAQTIGIVGLIVGGVGVATGVTLFVLSRPHENSAASWTITPRVGLGSASVSGTF